MQKEKIKSIKDLGLIIQAMIKTRFNKNVKLIFTNGKYKSLFLSFYKNHVYEFYVQDKNGYYLVYLLKDNKVIRKDYIYRSYPIENVYQKLVYFFKAM